MKHPQQPQVSGPEGKGDWSHVLIPRGASLLDHLEAVAAKKPGPPPPVPPYAAGVAWGVDGAKEGSPNHEAQAWAFEAVRAWLAGDGRFLAAKAVLLEAYFPREMGRGPRGIGLQASEQNCPSSHDAQHRNGTSFARLAAFLSKDPELLAASEELLLATVKAKLCTANADLTVCAPGMRSPGKPTFAGDSDWLRVALGHPPKAKGIDTDQFYIAVRCLEYLRRAGDPLLARTAKMTLNDRAPCVLKLAMDVYRGAGWYYAEMPKPKDGKIPGQVCDWVLAIDGREPQYGLSWQTAPAPMPGKADQRIHFPGIGER
jgi:hypothetical protein